MNNLIRYCVITLSCISSILHAKPWRPSAPNVVLMQFESATDAPIKITSQFVNDAARNTAVNTLMQRAYLQGDSRALGQAEKLMQGSQQPNSIENLLLSARVAQASHRFDYAKQLLLNVIQLDPQQYDAMLQLANIERLQGQFQSSLKYCAGLPAEELLVYRFGCEYQVKAMQQDLTTLKQISAPLGKLLPQLPQADQEWLANIQLEIATRFNDTTLAKQALAYLSDNNLPNAIAKANWYIKQKQPLQVLSIFKNYRYHDGALIRIIQSKQQLKDASAKTDLALLSSRMQQLQARKEQIHLREEAQYLLLKGQNQRGLQIAAQNWQIQRESDDFQVYAALAIATQDKASAKTLLQWSKQVGYRDPQYLPALLQLLMGAAT